METWNGKGKLLKNAQGMPLTLILTAPLFSLYSVNTNSVLSLVVKDYLTYRIVAAGTQNGTLNVGIIPRDPRTLRLDHLQTKTHTVVLFAPITTLAVFTSRVQPGGKNMRRRRRSSANRGDTEDIGPEAEGQGLDEQQHKDDDDDNDNCSNEHEKEAMAIHLLVTCAIEQAFVYRYSGCSRLVGMQCMVVVVVFRDAKGCADNVFFFFA